MVQHADCAQDFPCLSTTRCGSTAVAHPREPTFKFRSGCGASKGGDQGHERRYLRGPRASGRLVSSCSEPDPGKHAAEAEGSEVEHSLGVPI